MFSLKRMAGIKSAEIPEMISITAGIGERTRPYHGIFEMLSGGINIITELKHSSPAAGNLSAGTDDRDIIQSYINGGASAVSVLTEKNFFGGSYAHLQSVCSSCSVPVLCKDFVYYDEQVEAANACGADMVLLISRALEKDTLKKLYDKISGFGMTPLVEIHEPAEINDVMFLNPGIVMVNMRNLETLEIDYKTGIETLNKLPLPVIRISASGINNADDIRRIMDESGVKNFLIGSSLMRSSDPEGMIREFKNVR